MKKKETKNIIIKTKKLQMKKPKTNDIILTCTENRWNEKNSFKLWRKKKMKGKHFRKKNVKDKRQKKAH